MNAIMEAIKQIMQQYYIEILNQKIVIVSFKSKVFLDKNMNAKLGDFGLCKVVESSVSVFAKTFVGTPFYMSPELIGSNGYNTKSDIWALGKFD
jgi:serine/threonine protein kinase